jgi:hypothetical protein
LRVNVGGKLKMLTISDLVVEYKKVREENQKLLEENKRLSNDKVCLETLNEDTMKVNKKIINENLKIRYLLDSLSDRNIELEKEISGCIVEHQTLLNENRYLKQKVKEYRHKTWFPVYEENLKLQQELEQYKTVLTSVETFIGQYSKEKKGDKGCH